MSNYDEMTQDQFDGILIGILETMSANQIIDIPGVYEAVREELNNEVLSHWDTLQEKE